MKDKGRKILYVDDEEVNLFLFREIFKSDFEVFTASSGPEGLETLQHHSDEINVVISDMQMPEMNGLEFIGKAKDKFNQLICYILTGYEFNAELEDALEKKLISRMFRKPVDYELVKLAVME